MQLDDVLQWIKECPVSNELRVVAIAAREKAIAIEHKSAGGQGTKDVYRPLDEVIAES